MQHNRVVSCTWCCVNQGHRHPAASTILLAVGGGGGTTNCVHDGRGSVQAAAQERLEAFLQWLTRHLCDSLYAGAPHARRHFAVRGLHIVLAAFQHDGWLARPLHGADGGDGDGALRAALQQRHRRDTDALRQLDTAAAVQLCRFQPFAAEVFGPGLVQVLSAPTPPLYTPTHVLTCAGA